MQAPFFSGTAMFEISKPWTAIPDARNTREPLPLHTASVRWGLLPEALLRPISRIDLSMTPQVRYVPGATLTMPPGEEALIAAFKSENSHPSSHTVGFESGAVFGRLCGSCPTARCDSAIKT